MKIKVTAQQRENAIEAIEVMWPSVPPENVSRYLMSFTLGDDDRTSCRTVACFGGWCARWPGFIAQGARLDLYGNPSLGRHKGINVGQKLFGSHMLFMAREWDEIGTDHEVVNTRLHNLISNSEVRIAGIFGGAP